MKRRGRERPRERRRRRERRSRSSISRSLVFSSVFNFNFKSQVSSLFLPQMDSNSPHIFIDRLIAELSQPALSKTIKPLMLTLHCLFPNDFLPALDILDRKLVRRIVRSDRSSTSQIQEDIFIVLSTSIPPSLPGSSIPSQEKGYEVRLRAWNCSCPTFTLSAYRDPQLLHDSTNKQNQLAYSFGGTLARGTARVSPPTCKHILACILHARCPELFGVDGDDRLAVSKEELAGWCAGWGG